jgi:hypothetical protein
MRLMADLALALFGIMSPKSRRRQMEAMDTGGPESDGYENTIVDGRRLGCRYGRF